MALDKDTVKHIAWLARIRMSEEELDKMSRELSHIITWVEQLNQVDVEGVEPMSSVVEMQLRRREDMVTDGGCLEKVLANAPEATHGFFAVPKVIE